MSISARKALRSRLCSPNPLLLIPFANDSYPNASLCVAKALLCCSYARFAAPSLYFASPKPCFASTGVFFASCFALFRQKSNQLELVRSPTTLLSVLSSSVCSTVSVKTLSLAAPRPCLAAPKPCCAEVPQKSDLPTPAQSNHSLPRLISHSFSLECLTWH